MAEEKKDAEDKKDEVQQPQLADVVHADAAAATNGPLDVNVVQLGPDVTSQLDREVNVRLDRGRFDHTPDQALWTAIRYATDQLSYRNYEAFLEDVMCFDEGKAASADAVAAAKKREFRDRRALPFPDIEPYRLLKIATEVFLTVHCGVSIPQTDPTVDPLKTTLCKILKPRLEQERGRYYRLSLSVQDILQAAKDYREEVGKHETNKGGVVVEVPDYSIPYLAIIRRKLGDVPLRDMSPYGITTTGNPLNPEWFELCYGILREKLTKPCFLELIWSYWHEEGMLVQSLNAISQRFQNVRGGPGNPLGQLEISPLRPLSNLIWGYIQDEQHRLTVRRRVAEYDHHYGFNLYGKAVPELSAADSRSQFLEAFHNLLNLCAAFFRQDDDKTIAADAFPVLNGLKDVHLILSEGAHNQYGDLPWTARQEMLMQEWILARPEFREFLPTRIMVAYPEPWMDRVDAMKKVQGWTDVSVLNFRNLGVFGEQILLSVRFGAWTDVNDRNQAANWARYWRAEIQGYIHAYRAVTGVDITDPSETMTRLRYVLPSIHLRNRLAGQAPALPGARPASLPLGRPGMLPVNSSAPVRSSEW